MRLNKYHKAINYFPKWFYGNVENYWKIKKFCDRIYGIEQFNQFQIHCPNAKWIYRIRFSKN